jgi:FHS family L-fucose permease-like MFS transporter
MPVELAATAESAPARVPIVSRKYLLPFALVTTLFLSWALAASLNDVLIRQFQKALDLTRTQASLIQFAFYIGYFCAALPAGLLIRRVGYKRTMIAGLALYAAGAFLFYPAAEIRLYIIFLVALYTIAFGLAFLETSANPYVSILGDERTASARLNLAQSFYGIGAIIGPIVGGTFIFSGIELSPQKLASMAPAAVEAYRASEAHAVQLPYAAVGATMVVLAAVIALVRFPVLESERDAAVSHGSPWRVLRHKRLRRAIIAQFFYVGAQVCIWSFFIDFTKDVMPSIPERTVAFLLSASLAMLMIGRFSGAFIQRLVAPPRLLAIYGCANIALCLIAALSGGALAVGALWLTSFFMSIMFPTIFALGIEGLGEETEFASSFLIMSIIGGALIPPGLGIVSDRITGIHLAMIVPAVCFAVCVAFAYWIARQERSS